MKFFTSLAALFLLALSAALLTAQASSGLSVNRIAFSELGRTIEIRIELNRPSDFRAFVLANPNRIILDLPSFAWNVQHIDKKNQFIVSDIRQGALQEGFSRIVFDVRQTARIMAAERTDKGQILIAFEPASEAVFQAHKNDLFGNLVINDSLTPEMKKVLSDLEEPAPDLQTSSLTRPPIPVVKPQRAETEASPPPIPVTSGEKPMIVIDPGHGGIDPGAIGADNKKEKDVVLALGLALRDKLLASGRYRVAMTREKDTFLSLKDRVMFARKKEADLFISLHADSIHRSEVRGSSVYTLSKEASDAQTAKLAEKENSADLIAGVDLSVEDEQVAFILGDFLMTETLNQSKFFANMLVATMKDNGVMVLDNTHRFAGFAVLKAPDIPSVLVEAGFMSNKKEARLLTQKDHRNKISGALKAGIDAYFDHIAKDQALR